MGSSVCNRYKRISVMRWYKRIKIREGVGRQCTVMAPKARGSEILLCVGVCSCAYVATCAHTQISLCASLMAMRATVGCDES